MSEVVIAVVVIAISLAIYFLFFAPVAPASFMKLPGPPQPFGRYFGNMPNSPLFQQHLHFKDLTERYGKLVRKRVMGYNVLICIDAEYALEISKNKESFPDRPQNGIIHYLPKGLLALPTGPMWKAHRTTVSRIFADSFIRQYTDVFAAKAMELVDNMNKYDFTKSFNVHYDVSRLSLDAIGITGFGYNFNSLSVNDPYYYDAATIVCEGAVMRTLMPISTIYHMLQAKNWRDSRAALLKFVKLVDKIKAESEKKEAKTLLDILLEKEEFSHDEVVDEIMTMVLAGHETTANTIAWSVMNLALNPDVMKKAQAEIDEIWDEPGFDITKNFFDCKKRLKYLRGVFDETLRIYPSVPHFPRVCVKDTRVFDVDIPAGTNVYIALAAMGRSPENWEEPEKFKPERFIDNDKSGEDSQKAGSALPYFPFGGGVRQCIGRRFAEMEALTVLAALVRHFDFVLDESKPVVEKSHITLTSEDGIWVKATPRKHD